MPRFRLLAVSLAAALVVGLAGCGGAGDVARDVEGDTATPDVASPDAVETTDEDGTQTSDTGATDACPLPDPSDLTGVAMTQRGPSEGDIPWLDGVEATTCVYTADETDEHGDPVLLIRTDEVRGEHRETVREDFTGGCEDVGAAVQDVPGGTGAALCEQTDGLVLMAIGELSDSTVLVSIEGQEERARELRPVLEELLGLIR